ncbi:hypothetical protein D8S78_24225 [Natrialba swarupiae]|nr:hypothetical protein [Natrialba swarupiae]
MVNFVVAMTDPLHNQFITAQQLVDGVVVGTAGPLFWVHTIASSELFWPPASVSTFHLKWDPSQTVLGDPLGVRWV